MKTASIILSGFYTTVLLDIIYCINNINVWYWY